MLHDIIIINNKNVSYLQCTLHFIVLQCLMYVSMYIKHQLIDNL